MPQSARADDNGLMAFGFTLGIILETSFPDTHIEWTNDSDPVSVVFAWPFEPVAFPLVEEDIGLWFRPFIEPQIRLRDGLFRFAAGGRTQLFFSDENAFGVEVQGGGITGADGGGGFVGGGAIVGVGMANAAILYRHTRTNENQRHTITVNYVISWPVGGM